MKVNNTLVDFFQFQKSGTSFDPNEYHRMNPDIFKTYFSGYCKKTDEKLFTAKERYFNDYSRIEKINEILPEVIEKVATKGESYFGFSLDVSIHIFVGLYASNAFVDHRAEIYLAVEKLPLDSELLEIIIAHEMVHSYHYHILGRGGIEWKAIDWLDARNSVYLEGVATYFSQKLVQGHPQSVYYSYDRSGEEWLTFCNNNYSKIASAFLADAEGHSNNMEREWLRLSGGEHFGYNRLGYFLGTLFVSDLCKELPESKVLELLAEDRVSMEMNHWLQKLV